MCASFANIPFISTTYVHLCLNDTFLTLNCAIKKVGRSFKNKKKHVTVKFLSMSNQKLLRLRLFYGSEDTPK